MGEPRFKIGQGPTRPLAPHNQRTWDILESKLGTGSATIDEMAHWCRDHEHKDGGRGFVMYCIKKNRWLVPARGTGDCSATAHRGTDGVQVSGQAQAARSNGHVCASATGIYVACPTTGEMKPIYRGAATWVNNRHTKVGITKKSFAARRAYYEKVFGGEVEFTPLAEVPSHLLDGLEREMLLALSRQFRKVGNAHEWFDTDDRETVISLVRKVVDGFSD